MMRLLVWGAVLTALVAGWAPAQTAEAVAVDGTVKDGAGLAVAGAIVTLETAAGAEQRTTTADQAGAFHFGDGAAGRYKVTGAAGGGAEVPPRVQDPGGSGDAAGHGDRRGNPAGAEQIPGVRAGGGRLREAVRGAIYQTPCQGGRPGSSHPSPVTAPAMVSNRYSG